MAPRRSLKDWEVALIKAFIRFTSMNDQDILSYFSRPGRSLNHRVIREIRDGLYFHDVGVATKEELQAFQARWLELFAPFDDEGQRWRTPSLYRANDDLSRARNQYWIGENVDYAEIWSAYESGLAYINKFRSRPVYVMVIEFSNSNSYDPLFDHEAVFKTLKGLFHDLKRENMSAEEYNASGPMFLYSVERGSSIYRLMAGLRELLMHGMALSDEKIMKAHLDNTQKRLDFIRKNFRNVDEESARKFITARTTYEMDEGLEKLIQRGIKSVKISAEPVQQVPEQQSVRMIELKQLPSERQLRLSE